jgi:hypothetical protein
MSRTRAYDNKVDSSPPYFCTSEISHLIMEKKHDVQKYGGPESTLFSYVCAHVTTERVNARTYAHIQNFHETFGTSVWRNALKVGNLIILINRADINR